MASVGSHAAAAGTQHHSLPAAAVAAAGPVEGLMSSQPPSALQVRMETFQMRMLMNMSKE
jgi:hypothetical protein